MKKIKIYLLIHCILLLYSFCSVCSKIAASKTFLSVEFFCFYGLVIMILGIYAVLWQQILKYIPLYIAFANKAMTVIWGMLWGVLLFGEKITLHMIVGAIVVIVGVIIVVTGGEEQNE